MPQACKQGIKSKAGAIKCCKEIKITALPNEWLNIPFHISVSITDCRIWNREGQGLLADQELVEHQLGREGLHEDDQEQKYVRDCNKPIVSSSLNQRKIRNFLINSTPKKN